MKRNAELIAAEKEEAENNRQLILAIRDICDNLNVSATETMNNANSTWQGAEEQKRTVAGLEKTMLRLVEELNQSARVSKDVSDATYETVGLM